MIPTERILQRLLTLVGAAAVLSYVGLSAVHLNTLYGINHVSGHWMSLACQENRGSVYPPLHEDGFYGGTRQMPVYFSLHAMIARLTGEYLVSGRVATLGSMAALVVALVLALRRTGCSPATAFGGAAVFLATGIGHWASFAVRGDALALAFGLFALLVLGERGSWSRIVLAAVLAALAILTKFSSVAPLIVGTIVLLRRTEEHDLLVRPAGGRLLVPGAFLALTVALLAVGLLLAQWESGNRFFANLAALSGSGTGRRSSVEVLRAYGYRLQGSREFLVLLPLAILATITARRRLALWELYFLVSLLLSPLFFLDAGADYNHLIDLLAAALILTGSYLGREEALLRSAVLLFLAWMGIMGLVVYHGDAWNAPERRVPPARLIERLALPGKRFLSEDPTLPALLAQRPVVTDAFHYRTLAESGVIPPDELPTRIRKKEFDCVILLFDLRTPEAQTWYRTKHFGLRVVEAIDEAYVLDKQLLRYFVYVRR